MIVGIVGDTHNNLINISSICDLFNKAKVELVIHTGDITLPKSLSAFKKLNMPLVGVFGNNDQGEKEDLKKVAESFDCELFDEPHKIRLENKNILILHDPKIISDDLIRDSNVIFHGHTHRYRCEKINDTLIFNPGECAGFLKGKNKIGIINLNVMKADTISF
ncbi:MAG: YfcE family phosphodiesterase [Rickettsiales bacterium]|nr:YfcE family phosphodiesterase [Rickettsiales bacterium]